MKRLRKVLHAAMVWTTVSLLLVDPAAACRLIGRRCCRCCCQPASCDVATSAMPGQPSAFDAPLMAPIDADQLPADSLTAPAPSIGTFRLGEGLTPNVVRPGEARVIDATPAMPSPLGPTTLRPTVTEPSPATSFALPSIPRQAADAAPLPTTPIVAPRTGTDNSANATRGATLDPHGPMPTTLQPRQAFDPAVVVPQPTATDAARHQTAEIPPAKPSTAGTDGEPPMPMPKPAANTPKSPAAISAPPRSQPIQPPAFPPVADDPFALPPPAAAAPKPPSPADDDPFAPLPKPVAPPKPSTPPPTTEPTSHVADSLLPATDGRLPIREWSDNSGQFRIQARLVLIIDGKVRLLKETGRTTTVATERLSATDRQYVSEVIARYGGDLSALDQLAAR